MEVSKLLLSSHPTTCPLDPIPSHLLQAISPTLLPALTHIINTSLRTGIFPTAFKQARVTPLLKKPTLNTSLLENYRPVSLLPFVAKTLERAVFNQLSLFLSQYNKLDAKQSGSGVAIQQRLRYSQSLKPYESQRPIPNHQSSFCSIFSAAFDTVNHQILLSTLSSLVSLGFHFAGLNPISPVGPSRWPGVGRYPKHINWPLGFLRDRFLTPPLLHIHYITGTHHTGTWLLLPLLRR